WRNFEEFQLSHGRALEAMFAELWRAFAGVTAVTVPRRVFAEAARVSDTGLASKLASHGASSRSRTCGHAPVRRACPRVEPPGPVTPLSCSRSDRARPRSAFATNASTATLAATQRHESGGGNERPAGRAPRGAAALPGDWNRVPTARANRA